MITKKVVTIEEVKRFFDSSICTLEEAIGILEFDFKNDQVVLDEFAVKLLCPSFCSAQSIYKLDQLKSSSLYRFLVTIVPDDIKKDTEYQITIDGTLYNVKAEKKEDTIILYFIDYDVLLLTESEMQKLNDILRPGESIYVACTWWIDYDKEPGYFFQTDSGPHLLGVDINEDKIYQTSDFQKVREKAALRTEFYDECVRTEQAMYEKVRNNQTDYFGGRTPAITKDDKEVWVEAYGKCLIRYPDGSPRFFVAIDIYLSDLLEQMNTTSTLKHLVDQGLFNADVGIWYYQKYNNKRRFYYTDSWKRLMNIDIKEDMTVHEFYDIRMQDFDVSVKEQLREDIKAHTKKIKEVFHGDLDTYKMVVPNIKDEDGFHQTWVEIRGTCIERDENGDVQLFIGVNVDVSDTVKRNKELERLREENERLHLAEKLAIKAGSVLVWYHSMTKDNRSRKIFGNEMFVKRLGIKRDDQGLMDIGSLRRTIVKQTSQDRTYAKHFIELLNSIYQGYKTSMKDVLVKHRDALGNEVYFEHTIEVEETFEDGSVKLIGGFMRDVTENIKKQERIMYLANYDTLTGLRNRNYFENFISNDMLPDSYSVLIFDLDGLKLINDAFGHMEGDKVIKIVAKLLLEIFHNNVFIARIGGDEFIVVTEDIDDDNITKNANILEDKVDEYNRTHLVEMNVSKGGRVVINNDVSFERAFTHAENLMYRRKLGNRSSRKSKVLESIIETLNQKTEETKEHSDRIADVAVGIMSYMGLSRASEVEDMKLLARVHDIGKITIPDHVLYKPSKLNDEEYEIIKKHSEAGYKIIRNITDSDFVSEAVLSHHEWYNGSGYPQGLKGENIPLFARILSVADAFDAMTNNRVYHKGISVKEAVEEIKRFSGIQFDPGVVDAFLQYLNKE
jgi:diguanylate cyclase (GGDEF)-like protein